MDREDILSLLKNGKWMISVHEHIGRERLILENGIENDFKQGIGTLFKSLSALEGFGNSFAIASVVMTVPHFHYSNVKNQADNGYVSDNRALLADCSKWFSFYPEFMPVPFISADVHDSENGLKKQISRAEYPVMGIKFHPRSRNFSMQELLGSGLLCFAARIKLPVLMQGGDY